MTTFLKTVEEKQIIVLTPQGVMPEALSKVTDRSLREVIDICLKQDPQDR